MAAGCKVMYAAREEKKERGLWTLMVEVAGEPQEKRRRILWFLFDFFFAAVGRYFTTGEKML